MRDDEVDPLFPFFVLKKLDIIKDFEVNHDVLILNDDNTDYDRHIDVTVNLNNPTDNITVEFYVDDTN